MKKKSNSINIVKNWHLSWTKFVILAPMCKKEFNPPIIKIKGDGKLCNSNNKLI